MLSNILDQIPQIVEGALGVMSGVTQLWPVAVMLAFLMIGIGVSYIKKLAGGKKGRKRARR